jgi:hypothetical protein
MLISALAQGLLLTLTWLRSLAHKGGRPLGGHL